MCPFTEHSRFGAWRISISRWGQHKQVLSHLAQQAKEGSRTVLRNQLFSVPDVCSWTNQGSDSSVTQNP